MGYDRTFNRTVTYLTNGTNFDEDEQIKVFNDMGTLQTDLTSIETETDSLDANMTTANANILALQNDLNWESNYSPYYTSFSLSSSTWNDACNITGEGWISGLMVGATDIDDSGGDDLAISLAINVDGTDIKTTSSPLVCSKSFALTNIDYDTFQHSVYASYVNIPLTIHFDSSCRIQVKRTGGSTASYKFISYWL